MAMACFRRRRTSVLRREPASITRLGGGWKSQGKSALDPVLRQEWISAQQASIFESRRMFSLLNGKERLPLKIQRHKRLAFPWVSNSFVGPNCTARESHDEWVAGVGVSTIRGTTTSQESDRNLPANCSSFWSFVHRTNTPWTSARRISIPSGTAHFRAIRPT